MILSVRSSKRAVIFLVAMCAAAGWLGGPVATPAEAGPATHLVVLTVGDNRAGDGFTVIVEARDASNAVDTTYNGTVTISAAAVGGSNFVGGPLAVSADDGVATFAGSVINNAADNYTISATAGGLTGGTSNAFDVTARSLAVTSVVSNVPSGSTFNLTVEGRDGNNNLAENLNGTVTLTAAALGGSDFQSTPSTSASAGIASFSNLVLRNAADGYVVTASSAGLNNGTSNTFNVTATHLAILPSGDQRSGDTFSLTVQALDVNNQVAENFTGNVSLSAAAAGGSNFAPPPAASAAIAGNATFNNLVLNNAANGYTVTATSPGVVAGTDGFNVTAHHFVITNALGNVTSGSTFAVNVEARDGNNNLAENFNGPVTLSADAPGTGDSNFAATPSTGAVAGSATFSNVALRNAADGYVVTASSTAGVTPPNDGPSNAFNVTATHLNVSNPGERRAGDGFTVTVEARDIDNRVAENFTGSIDISLDIPAGGDDFAANPPAVNAAAGTATFNSLVLNDAADNYSITSTNGSGVTNDTSNLFDVTARSLVMSNVLSNVQSGSTFPVTVQARDGNNNLAENFNGQVTLFADAPGTGDSDFAATPSTNALAGSATFSNVALRNAADGYVVIATSTAGVTDPNNAASNAFNVTASHLNVSNPGERRAGDAFSVTVEARDIDNRVAENFTGTIDISLDIPAGGDDLAANPAAVIAAAGTASFNGLALNDAADNYSITTTNGSGVTNDTSSLFDVTARSLVITNVLSNVQSGSTFPVTVQARDANNNVAENFDGSVTLSADAPGSGDSDFATTPSTNAGGGVASFANLVLGNAADGYVVSVSSTAGTTDPNNGASNAFNVTASSLQASDPGEVRAGDPFDVTVTARDADGGVAENFAGSIALTTTVPTGGSGLVSAPGPQGANAGTAQFTNLELNDAADNYSMTSSSAGLPNDSTTLFDVTARTLAFRNPLSNVFAGDHFVVVIDALDAQAVPQLAENFEGTVTLAAAAATGSDFAVTPSQSALNGTATFSGLTLDDVANGYVLTASSPSGSPPPSDDTSNSFNVVARPAPPPAPTPTTSDNEPPFANDDTLSIARDPSGAPATGTVDVLANDTDPDGDELEVSAFAATSANGGVVSCTAQGVCTYTEPTAPCVPSDSFGYTASDGEDVDRGRVAVSIGCRQPGPDPVRVDRTVSLELSRHLFASGLLDAGGVSACTSGQTVRVQKRVRGRWVLRVETATKADGTFRVRLRDRQGLYRVRVPASEGTDGTLCGVAVSATARHKH